MAFRSYKLFFLLIPTLLLAACGDAATAVVTLRLAPTSDLPPEVRQMPPEVRNAYRFALANREILEAIPCYCGCGAPPHGHRSNADCYFQTAPDGTAVLDSHALT